MADHLPFCIHCGAQQLTADSRFCYRCGQSILSATPRRGRAAPWLAPVLVSVAIIIVAGVLLMRWQLAGPTASAPAALNPQTVSTTPSAPVTPTATQMAVTDRVASTSPSPSETPTPSPSSLPEPTPTPVTPQPMQLSRLTWSPDGMLLAIGSATGVYLYDTATWREARFIPMEVGDRSWSFAAKGPAFSFDGTLLATRGRVVQVWWVADGSLAYELKASTLLAASPVEGLWATDNGYGGSSAKLRLWRVSDGQLVRELSTGREYGVLQDVFFSSDGQLIATTAGEADGFVVSRVADGGVLSKAPQDSLWSAYGVDLAFRPGTSTMAYIGSESMLGLWNAMTGTLIRQLIGPTDTTRSPAVYRVDFAPDGVSFATLHSAGPKTEGGTIQLWQADGTSGQSWSIATRPSDLGFSRDGRLLAVVTGQSFYLYNPSDGSMVRQVEPTWHQGILPTPTPTPLSLGLNLPADWKDYYDLGGSKELHFKLRIPPTWVQEHQGASYFRVPSSSINPLTAMRVQIHSGYCGRAQGDPGSQASVESVKRMWTSYEQMKRVFVSGGTWPLIIPATYGEFDTTYNLEGPKVASVLARRKTREIILDWRTQSGECVLAWLEDELEDISEQDRLEFSRVVASIEFEDEQHPFPTATPTFTPTPNPAPPPALPLQILFDAKASRSSGGGGSADITIDIKDAYGNPVNGAEVKLSCGWGCYSVGLSRDGRYTTSFGSTSDDNHSVSVEVCWNQELIAQQDFVISWQ